MLKAIGGIVFLLALASFTAATCSPFLSVTMDGQREVRQGVNAIYLLQVRNTGSAAQSISAASTCPNGLDCQFPDASNPVRIVPGETAVIHLQVGTSNAEVGNYSIPVQVTSDTQCVEDRLPLLFVTSAGSAPTPAPQEAIVASIAPAEDIATQPGRKITFSIYAENTLPQTQFVEVTTAGNPFATQAILLPTSFEMAPHGKKNVQVELTVPTGTPGGLYNLLFRVRGTSSSGRDYLVDLPVKVFVYASNLFLRFSSYPTGQCLTVFHGSTASRQFDLINSGQITGPFDAELRAGDDIYPDMRLSRSRFEAANNERINNLKVDVTPKESLAPGTYHYTLFVSYLSSTALRYDDCVTVKASIGIEGFSQEEYAVLRGTVTQLKLHLTNNGSLASDYSVDYNPLPASGIELSVDPTSFRLPPRQEAGLTMTVAASKDAPLGIVRVPLTLRSPNLTRELILNLKVISDNRTSPLQIANNRFAVFEGSPTQATVRVLNTGSRQLDAVQLITEGLPRQWVHVDSGPKNMPTGSETEFLVTFDIPSGSTSSTSKVIPFAIYAASGLESVREDAALDLFASIRDLQFAVSEVRTAGSSGGVREVSIDIILRNAGNVATGNIRPSLPYSSEYVINADRDLSLAPQQSTTVTLTISPTTDSPEQDVLLRFASDDGAQATKPVRLPAMSRDSDNSLFWKVMAIILLIVAIFAALNKQAE